MISVRKIFAALFLIAATAHGSETPTELPMPFKTTGAPAIDLVYQGKAIDRDEAADLSRKGIDLSRLDPLPNDAWQAVPLPVSNAEKFSYPPENGEVRFLNDIAPNGMYRGQVEYFKRPFRLIVDMDNHQALANAALLRKLGYPVDMPKFYRSLSIRFDTADQMNNFVENFAFETQFSRDRWLKKVDTEKNIVFLQDVNLEYPRIDVQPLYNGIINTSWIAGHRAMRALIIPFMLLDVRLSENSMNMFSWEFARVFAENLMLSHAYVSAFKETTYEDARWIARKIALLSEDEIKAIIHEAGFPPDIETALFLQRVIAKRNHLVKIFKLESEIPSSQVKLPYSTKITFGKVIKGEATQEYYPGYAARFTVGDPASPLRWSELKHYVKMEAISQGVRVLTDKINKELQFRNTQDGIESHKEKILNDIVDHFKKNPNDPYVVPVKPWIEPLYGLNFNASRSLVTGTYYGSESKAQLVDNMTVGASIGGFGGIDGRTYLQNFGMGGSVSYQRTYTHVRPIASLEAVKAEKWKNLFVPGFLKGTAKILKWPELRRKFIAFQAEYIEAQRIYPAAYSEYSKEVEAYKKAWKANCDEKKISTLCEACELDPEKYPRPVDPTPNLKKRYEEVIGTELPAGREIPALSSDPENPSKLPENFEDTVILSALTEFLDEVRDNEVYTITDSFVNQISPQIQIPITTFAGMGVADLVGEKLYGKIAPSVGVSMTGQWAVLKRLMMMRHGDQFTVYDTKMNTRALGAAANFSAWIELAKISGNRKNGGADTKAMMLDLSPVTDEDKAADGTLAEQRKVLLSALAELLSQNEIEKAEEISPPYKLHHDLQGKLKSAKVLMWNWASYAETHKVKVTPPADPENRYNPDDVARTLYSARKMNLTGKNPYGMVGQVLSKAVGVNGLFDSGGNQNPSGTFLGAANWQQVRAESEITTGKQFKPMLILEEYYSGWFLSKDKLLKILESLQAEVKDLNLGQPIYRPDVFASTTQLQAYEVRSSIVLYPSGTEKLEAILFKPKSRQQLLLNLLDLVDKGDFKRRCRKYFEDKNIEPELEAFEQIEDPKKVWNRCIQPWMRKVMRHVRKAPPRDRKETYTEWLSTTMYIINRHLDISQFLKRIGNQNFFFQVRVSGFRKGDENATNKNGETDYLTDTIGTIQSPISLGPFRDLSVYSGGREWQISDYELQARYFGEGL
jgi:hypothetical protein